MRVIRKIKDEVKEVNYPHIDISNKVAGLDDGIVYYYIEQLSIPEYDTNKSYLKSNQVLTDTIHPEYPHLLICERGYDIIDYPKETIIEKLSTAVGDWIEERLPVWKQVKYISRFMYLDLLKNEGTATDTELLEMSYLNDVDNWVIKCRADRDLREEEYISNGVFPSFTFDDMPEKTY